MKKAIYLCMILSFMWSCSNAQDPINDQNENESTVDYSDMFDGEDYTKHFERPSDTYTYIDIESDEYKQLCEDAASMEEVYAAFEIPAETLKNMSTAGIIQSFIEYPFFMDFTMAYPSMQYTVEHVKSMNLGKELITRKDAGEWLARYFITYPEDQIKQGIIPDYVRILVSIPEVCNSMTVAQKKQFLSKILSGISLYQNYDASGNVVPQHREYYMCGKVLQSAGYKPLLELVQNNPSVAEFLNVLPLGCSIPDITVFDQIHVMTNNYLLNK